MIHATCIFLTSSLIMRKPDYVYIENFFEVVYHIVDSDSLGIFSWKYQSPESCLNEVKTIGDAEIS